MNFSVRQGNQLIVTTVEQKIIPACVKFSEILAAGYIGNCDLYGHGVVYIDFAGYVSQKKFGPDNFTETKSLAAQEVADLLIADGVEVMPLKKCTCGANVCSNPV